MQIITMLDQIAGKKTLIVGWGREGESTYRFLRKRWPRLPIAVADLKENLETRLRQIKKRDRNFGYYLGKDYLKAIGEYKVVFRAPGVPPYVFKLEEIKHNKQIITSQTEVFLKLAREKTIGITGTKGKSTTASLTACILEKSGRQVELLGNIGQPVFEFFNRGGQITKRKIFVVELSSHQLCDIKASPHIAVILNITREHLDYYKNFRQYLDCKQNITLYQRENDILIYADYENPRKIAKKTKALAVPFSRRKKPCPGYYIEDDKIVSCKKEGREVLVGENDTQLLGDFNLDNVLGAVAVADTLGISKKIIRQAVAEFKPLPHRLERVGEYKEIIFFNDALATTPEATIAAIETFKGKVGTIILGGSDRKQNFRKLAEIVLYAGIENVILLPDTGAVIKKSIYKQAKQSGHNLPRFFEVKNLKKAVSLCYTHTRQGKVCLLSTASPSFSLFKDYQEKGDLFKRYVRELAKRT